MRIHFLRHATLVAALNDLNILVDPMLSPAQAMEPVANAANQRRIPLIELPLADGELRRLLETIDIVLVTHTHRDHWDARAVELLPKSIPILCQPEGDGAIREAGFTSVTPIDDHVQRWAIDFYRTGGQHGTGEIDQKMGTVSGFALKASGEPTLYIAGDTIWCAEVQTAVQTYRPDVVVVNAGAARFLVGEPITMTADAVCQVCRELPSAQVVAVHMEAVNHCGLTRDMLRSRLIQEGLDSRVQIPADGAVLNW